MSLKLFLSLWSNMPALRANYVSDVLYNEAFEKELQMKANLENVHLE